MQTKINPISKQLGKLKGELVKGDYLLIVSKLNENGHDVKHQAVLNAMSGRLQNTEKLTLIRDAAKAFIEERKRTAENV